MCTWTIEMRINAHLLQILRCSLEYANTVAPFQSKYILVFCKDVSHEIVYFAVDGMGYVRTYME